MIDTHSHINTKEFDNKIDLILNNAKTNGVRTIFAVGMDYETSVKAINLANKYPNIYATAGLHPGYVNESNHLELDKLYSSKKVIAVGEIGLDYYWQDDNRALQEKIFEEQLIKAIKLSLPVIIHTRNSFDETYQIVKKYQGQISGVFHCFSSTLEDAIKTVELGFYIGIDGPITFAKNEPIRTIVEKIDLKHFLIETDSPYLSPVPFRGKKNEPANVLYVAKKIAQIKNVTVDEVIRQTSKNAIELFKLEENIL